MLQHLVRIRWEELGTVERRQMASMAVDMIEDMAKPYEEWGLKSQAASLLAEVARREGPRYLKETLPTLFEHSSRSPMHAELVAMILRWLPEDITIHNEDLEGERRRQLLSALTQSLSETLPFLYKLLDHHFGAAMTFVQQNQVHLARQHAATVTAALNAILAYAEWAPVTNMANYGLIEACGFLLSSVEFRLSACEFLKLIASRRRPADEAAEVFDSAMVRVFEVLSNTLEEFFKQSGSRLKSSTHDGFVDESEIEFAGCLCEAMVALGSQNLYSIKGDKLKLTIYLQQMLMFFQHQRLALHVHALPFWLVLLRDLSATIADTNEAEKSGHARFGSEASSVQFIKDNKSSLVGAIPFEIHSILLDVAFQRILRKNVDKGGGRKDENDDWTDEFSAPNDFSQYRSRLIELIRLIAAQQPVLAISKISQRIEEAIHSATLELSILEGTQTMLETILNAIPESVMVVAAPTPMGFSIIMEGLVQRLLSIEWKEPPLVEFLGRHFDAIGPYLRFSPAAVPLVIQKIFVLLTSLPLEKESAAVATARTRLQLCTSFVRIARAAGPTFLPHMQAVAETMTSLQRQGLLSRGEHNLLGEALLVAASVAGREHQKQVLSWLLGPIKEQWLQTEWQNKYLSDPGGLIELVSLDESQSNGEMEDKKNEEMWFIFQSVALIERALRRCSSPSSGQDGTPLKENSSVDIHASSMPEIHPMLEHMAWIFPPLLKLLRCIHSLWSPPITFTLPTWMREALSMGINEQLSLLGGLTSRSGAGDVPDETSAVSQIEVIRNWLKVVRDSGYNVLGLAATRLGASFFNDADGRVATLTICLLENLSSMEFRHIRQLLHAVVIPLVKACPQMQWGPWLSNIIPPILIHCQQVLPIAWNNLIKEGAVKTTEISSVAGLTGLKNEVMEEKLLRDLTRETCTLLSVLASPQSKQGQRSSDQSSQTKAVDSEEMEARSMHLSSQSMLWCVMQHGAAAVASLKLGIEALKWPDTEAVHKAIAFCATIVSLAENLNDSVLMDTVGIDMLTAVIQGLALESNASAQAELLGLLREIYVRLSGHTSSPQQVLLALPSITADTLAAFDSAMKKTSSSKEQRQHIKSLLLAAGGDHFKALKAQKNTNVITNVTSASMAASQEGRKVRYGDSESIGLAAMVDVFR